MAGRALRFRSAAVPAPETAVQQALVQWSQAMAHWYPELGLLNASMNAGKRGRATASRAKAEGMKAGVPDICLPVPRGPWHGLYIELKVGGNVASPEQEDWIIALSAQGYRAVVRWGLDAGIAEIEAYLALPKPPAVPVDYSDLGLSTRDR